MPKVTGPLLSRDARGQFARSLIFKRGGVVVNYFKPRNPNSEAQQAQRAFFLEEFVPGLTQEQADLLYAAIGHLHDDRYSLLGHEHTYAKRYFLPIGVFAAVSPLTGTQDPYGAAIDRELKPISLSYCCLVGGVNDGSNYWRIYTRSTSGDSFNVEVDTSLDSGSTWLNKTVTSFPRNLNAGMKGIFWEVAKYGSPGSLLLLGPLLEVEIV